MASVEGNQGIRIETLGERNYGGIGSTQGEIRVLLNQLGNAGLGEKRTLRT